ncbi:MAG: hypothetical protein KW788_04670 [Candidatus Doudnabacteria bacterium]|nr:hypothetical protein [Candidatus Doudnabacteria bacterium]
MYRRQFLQKGPALVIGLATIPLSGCGAQSPNSPSPERPATPPTQTAVANPVDLKLAGEHYKTFSSSLDGTLQDALTAENLNPGSSLVGYTNPNGTRGSDFLIHTLNGKRPENGYDFMINNGHYFASAYNFHIRKGDTIQIFMPPKWDGVSV